MCELLLLKSNFLNLFRKLRNENRKPFSYLCGIDFLTSKNIYSLGVAQKLFCFCKGLAVMQDGSSIYRILKYVCDPATKQCLCGRHVLVDTYPSKSKRI